MNTSTRLALLRICLVIAVLASLSARIQYVTAHSPVHPSKTSQRSIEVNLVHPVVFTTPSDNGQAIDVWFVDKSATKLLTHLNEAHPDHSFVNCKLSPDALHVACWLKYDGNAKTSISIIDTSSGERTVVDAGKGELTEEKGEQFEEITSVTWVDNEHVIDAKVTWPSNADAEAAHKLGKPYPIKADIVKVGLKGSDKVMVITSPVHRVLGISPDAKSLFVTYLIPSAEDWKMEGFARLNLTNGQLDHVWPKDESAHYYDFRLINLASGKQRIVFIDGRLGPGLTVWSKPPIVYIGDPETGGSSMLMTNEDEKTDHEKGSDYNFPMSLIWSQVNDEDVAYMSDGEPVWATPSKGVKTKFGKTKGFEPLALTTEGVLGHIGASVVILNAKDKKPLSVQADAAVSPTDALAVQTVVSNYDVPFIHQLWDTKDSFNGDYACGPTSATMVLAYFKKIRPDPITVNAYGAHQSLFGKYVTDQYSIQAACTGASTFSDTKRDPNYNYFAGVYGAVIGDYCGGPCSSKESIRSFLNLHDSGTSDGSVTEAQVKAELDGGGIVILGGVMGILSLRHILVIRGYTDNGMYIVNDPYGNGTDRSFDGAAAQYTWAYMNPSWYLAVYGSHYVSDVRNDYTATSKLSIQNSYAGAGASVDVCLMNPNGTRNTTLTQYISANGKVDVGIPWGFAGDAIVRPKQTGVAATNVNQIGTVQLYDYAGTNSALSGSDVSIPGHYCNYYNWQSQITVQNVNTVGTGSDMATVNLYDTDGVLRKSQSIWLNKWAQTTLNLCDASMPATGSVRVVGANGAFMHVWAKHQPAANLDALAYEGAATTTGLAYAPYLAKNYYGWNSSTWTQNRGGGQWVQRGYSSNQSFSSWINTNGMKLAEPLYEVQGSDWVGSGWMNGNGSQIAVAEHWGNYTTASSLGYILPQAKSLRLLAPRVRWTGSGWTDGFYSSITVYNPGPYYANVRAQFFDPSGAQRGLNVDFGLASGTFRTLSINEIPKYFDGSALITSSVGTTAVVHEGFGNYPITAGYAAIPPGKSAVQEYGLTQ